MNVAPRESSAVRMEIRRKKWWLFHTFYYRFRSLNGKDIEEKRIPQGVIQQIFKDLKKIDLLSYFVWNFKILFQVDVKIIFWILTDSSTSSLFLLMLLFSSLFFYYLYFFFMKESRKLMENVYKYKLLYKYELHALLFYFMKIFPIYYLKKIYLPIHYQVIVEKKTS